MPAADRLAATYLAALERRDLDAIEALLAPDVVQVLPLAASGGVEPAARFEGREEVMGVHRAIVDAFDPLVFLDQVHTVADDGRAVFVETVGERRTRDGDRVYRNVYLYQLEVRDGLIARITEYSNPVAFARFFGRPVG